MRFIITSIFIIATVCSTIAQAPTRIPYQAVARDMTGQPLNNASINARFTIHDATATGIVVWQEIQTVVTSALGLFTVQLGSNITMMNVNWALGAKFMQVEIDLGSGFVDIGTQQMLSVPYAMHAGNGLANVSSYGDTLHISNGGFLIIPGISDSNSGENTGSTIHTCGALGVHNASHGYGNMTDQEGNQYKTVQIGSQVWMAENLNCSIYRNGDSIHTSLSALEWSSTNEGAWSYYNDDPSNACPFGKLYNWYTCVDERQLCPVGWHVPNGQEWVDLASHLGGMLVAGGKMKSAGTLDASTGFWAAYNIDATNSSGFSALPGGVKLRDGAFGWVDYIANFWFTTSPEAVGGEYNVYINYNEGRLNVGSNFGGEYQSGCSVRCLHD